MKRFGYIPHSANRLLRNVVFIVFTYGVTAMISRAIMSGIVIMSTTLDTQSEAVTALVFANLEV